MGLRERLKILDGDSEAASKVVYLQPAPLADILYEQLDYLISVAVSHATVDITRSCECAECRRLRGVSHMLVDKVFGR